METEITDIGKVAITPRKDYKNEQTYEWLDVVTYDGASYMCISEDGCTGIVPTNTEYWQLLADKGRFTEEDKEAFKQAVVEESKTTIDEHIETKKTEIDNYTTNLKTSLKNELDTYEKGKEEELDIHKTTLETKMTTTKDGLVQEIKTAQNGFDENVTLKTTEFNNNVTEQTNTFNSNAETKTADFNTNASTKQTEYDNNATSKLEEYNSNATAKVNEFNENAESYEKRIADLEQERDEIAEQMPWKTTDIQESIHIEDSAKYSRNKLLPFGNMTQETREGYNLLDTSVIATQTINGVTVINNGDGSLTLNGTATKSFSINIEITQKTISAGSYTKYITKDTNIGTGLTASLGTTTSGAISITTLQPKIGIGTLELTEDLTYNQLRLYINSGTVFNNYVLKWMFVKGTYTENTIPPYEQYGAMPSIDYPSMPVVATGVQKITKIGKNYISTALEDLQQGGLDSSTGDLLASTTRVCHNKFFEIDYDNVAQNFTFLIEDGYRVALRVYDRNKKYIGILNFTSFLTSLPQEYVGTGVKYIKLIFAKTDNSDITPNDIKDIKVMIAKGTNQSYEQYKAKETFELDLEDTELCKITDTNGNVVAQDRFIFKDDRWQIERNIKKLILNGSEKWTQNELWNINYATIFHAYISLSDWKIGQANAVLDKMKFTSYSNYLDYVKKEICLNHKSNIVLYLFIKASRLETFDVNGLKKFLSENNMIIYYESAEAEYEDCTEAQAEVLNKLHKLSLAKGTNNIFLESENGVTTELQLEYMQDNNLIKEQQHKAMKDEIDTLKQAVVALGGVV